MIPDNLFCYLCFGFLAFWPLLAIVTLLLLIRETGKIIFLWSHKGSLSQAMKFDTLRLQRSIVLLMAKMLQTDKHRVLPPKLDIIGNYIRFVFKDKKQRNKAFDMLKVAVQKSYGKEKHPDRSLEKETNAYIDKMKKGEVIKGSSRMAHGLSVASSFLGALDIHAFENNLSGKELGAELAKCLNQFQRRYVAYLLLRIAVVDDDINDDEKSALTETCVDALQIPADEFQAMLDAWSNKQLDVWYQQNIQVYNPSESLDSDDLLDIFAGEENKPEKDIKKKNFPSLSLYSLRKFFFCPTLLAWSVCALNLGGNAGTLEIIFFISTTLAFVFSMAICFSPIYSYSDTFGTIFYIADIRNSTLILLALWIIEVVAFCSSLLTLPAIMYKSADSHYGCDNVPVNITITSKTISYHNSRHNRSKSYHFHFAPIEADSVHPDSVHALTPLDKNLLTVLDKATLPYFKKLPKALSEISVDRKDYEKYNENDVLSIVVRKGYYGPSIYGSLYIFY